MKIPHRTLGKTGLSVSEIGLGAWQIGADWGEVVPEEVALATLRAAEQAGITLIDTADIYGAGRSERLIGKFLAERGGQGEGERRISIITKMGRGPGWSADVSAVRRAAEGSCERLGVTSLDLVQLHCLDEDLVKAGEVIASLETIKAEGLIRHYGLSVETISHARWVIENTGAATLQVIFNVFRQRLIEELFPAAQAANIGIIARVPLASGVLSGKFSTGHRFNEHDHRHFNCDGQKFNVGETFAGVPFAKAVEFAEDIRGILATDCPGATLAQKTMRWILDFPAVSTVIPGAKTPAQAQDNAATALLPRLSDQSHIRLKNLYRDKIHATVRGKY